jgi:4-hydroxybenzoate polyprenyltransferase
MSQVQITSGRELSGRLASIARVQDWWSCKFSPVLATFYASACLIKSPVWPLLPRLLVLVLALVVGATYVSVINDWTDRDDDLAGGKINQLAAAPAVFPLLILTACLGIGLGMGIYFWQYSHVSSLLYLGAWVAFSCYSWPPIRLKKRGLPGVLADALGSHFFPQLLTVTLVSAWTGRALPPLWYGAVGAWALACGLRNILLHQLSDVEADEAAGTNTWVRMQGPRFIQRLGQLVIFPVEVVAFGLLLLLSRQLWPVVLLLVYGALEAFKWRIWGSRPTILAPHSRMLLTEYYEVFYPLGFVLALGLQHPIDGLLLGLHLLLFGVRCWQTVRQLGWAGALIIRKAWSYRP